MIRRLLSLSSPGLLALALAAADARPAGAQRTVDVRRATTPTVSFRIVGSFSELRIRGWDKDSVVITGTIPVDARFEGGFGGNSKAPTTGAKFYLETPSGLPAGKLEARVPARARVWVKSGSADIDAAGVVGGLDLNIVGGSVRVAGSPHELTVESMDGSVTLDGAPSWLRVKTATGDVVVAGGSDDAALTSVSGAIRVASGSFDRIRLESVTGPVTFAADVVPAGTLDVNTHSGSIELRLSRKAPADFDIATVAGLISNGITGRPAIPGREGRGQEIGFTTGSGGSRIYVRSFKGNVQLLAR
jgi:hypothetical protein